MVAKGKCNFCRPLLCAILFASCKRTATLFSRSIFVLFLCNPLSSDVVAGRVYFPFSSSWVVPLCASTALLGMETSPLKCKRWKNQAVLTSNFFVLNVYPKAFSCVGRGILKNHEVSKIDLALYVCILCPQGSGSKVVGC